MRRCRAKGAKQNMETLFIKELVTRLRHFQEVTGGRENPTVGPSSFLLPPVRCKALWRAHRLGREHTGPGV
jgi:hypothetical protein